MTKWLEIAHGEMGQAEIAGANHNARIVDYFKATDFHAPDDETPWCSAFVNWCMVEAGIPGTGKANARSWLPWGRDVKPVVGCVAILSRGNNSAQGHVGYYLGSNPDGTINILSGNQSNKVCVQRFAASRVLGYRWPDKVPLPVEVQPLKTSQVVQGTAISAGASGLAIAQVVTEILPQIQGAGDQIHSGQIVAVVCGAVALLAALYALYARIKAVRR
jgi:uncharacterized protein (TIGR02594 family)